eukprot:285966_1
MNPIHKDKTELITFGYFRDVEKILSFENNPWHYIPIPIINITSSYLYNYFMNYTRFTWKISGLNVHKMLNAKCGQRFDSDIFNLGKLKFQLEVFPNGNIEDRKGYLVIHIRLLSLPSYIDSIIVLRYFHVIENMASDAWIALLKQGEYDYWGKKCPLIELKELQTETITIQVDVNINQIILKENVTNYITPIEIEYERKYKLEYKLCGKELEMFKNSKLSKQFNTDIFDHSMGISLYPNGTDERSIGYIAVYVTICKFPSNLLDMSVQYSVKCLEKKDENYSRIANFSYDELSWGPTKFMKLDSIKDLETVTFVTELNVLHINKTKNINMREICDDMQIKQLV